MLGYVDGELRTWPGRRAVSPVLVAGGGRVLGLLHLAGAAGRLPGPGRRLAGAAADHPLGRTRGGGRLLVPSPAHLDADIVAGGDRTLRARAARGRVILHEFRRRGCEVYSADGLADARRLTAEAGMKPAEAARVAMCLTAGLEDEVFGQIEWFGRVVAPPRPAAPPPVTPPPPPPSPVAQGKPRQKAGRKPFGDEETLRRMTDLSGEGKSPKEIAAALNGEGRTSPTGKGFTPKLVWYYLSSRNTAR